MQTYDVTVQIIPSSTVRLSHEAKRELFAAFQVKDCTISASRAFGAGS